MGLFDRKNSMLNVIRCDEEDFLIWKWSPDGDPNNARANSIRFGSSLRVRDGHVAAFVYHQTDGKMQDFIEGPYDQVINTQNFPVLSSIVGAAFGGSSPFQAEVYFINLQGTIRLPFFVDGIKVVDLTTQMQTEFKAKGELIFNIKDYRSFIKNNALRSFDMDDLSDKVHGMIISEIQSAVGRIVFDLQIPVMAISARRDELIKNLTERIGTSLQDDFSLNLVRLNLTSFDRIVGAGDGQYDLYLEEWRKNYATQGDVYRKNLEGNQAIAQENLQKSLEVQRDITREQGMLGARQTNLGAYQVEKQAEVGVAAAQGLGQMGAGAGISGGMGGGGGMNPAAMMTSMMMGTALGGGMSNMMTGMMNGLGQPQPPQAPQPPAAPMGALAQYYVANGGQQFGPFTLSQLQQLAAQGSVTTASYAWMQGMPNWLPITQIPELAALFAQGGQGGSTPPPVPPTPQTPPAAPTI